MASIVGTIASEYLEGTAGDDTVLGVAGDDTLEGFEGNDWLDGGDGQDMAQYTFWNLGSGVVFDGSATGTAAAVDVSDGLGGTDRLVSVEALGLDGSDHADRLTGGAGDDELYGWDGNDSLASGVGDDWLAGGAGNDTLIGGEGLDIAEYNFWNADAGILFDGSATGTAAVVDIGDGEGGTDRLGGIESLAVIGSLYADTITGGAGDDILFSEFGEAPDSLLGGGGNDAIQGGAGNDTLGGGDGNDNLLGRDGNDWLDGGAGADVMYGTAGDDTYIIDDAGDYALERTDFNEGMDTVLASVTHTLRANVENLTLTGNAISDGTGNAVDNLITGNGAANFLMGHAGNDTLIGNAGADTLNGGAGADRLQGGFGGDVFVVDSLDDVVVELPAQGSDRVSTSVSWTLGANVEHLTLAANAGHISGAGNELANLIQGNAGNNRLTGLAGNDTLTGAAGNDTLDGGAGADYMVGQEGDDTYFVDAIGDMTIESYPSFGLDSIVTSISRTISTHVENLTLIGSAIRGAGSALANVITGNELANSLLGVAGHDTLIGGAGNDTLNGGLGADRMEGGAGDDVYAVDSTGDVVVELAGEGTDRVSSTVSWVLGSEVENLTLAGTAAISGTGNALANVITGTAAANAIDGGAGADTLSGGDGNDTLTGGAGNDRLTGGTGADRFRFVTTGEGTDTITDFASGSDKILVVAANFGLVAGSAANLVVNSSPGSAAAVFLYTSATGSLAFDGDGNGAGAAVPIALLTTKPATMLPTDIVIGP